MTEEKAKASRSAVEKIAVQRVMKPSDKSLAKKEVQVSRGDPSTGPIAATLPSDQRRETGTALRGPHSRGRSA